MDHVLSAYKIPFLDIRARLRNVIMKLLQMYYTNQSTDMFSYGTLQLEGTIANSHTYSS